MFGPYIHRNDDGVLKSDFRAITSALCTCEAHVVDLRIMINRNCEFSFFLGLEDHKCVHAATPEGVSESRGFD